MEDEGSAIPRWLPVAALVLSAVALAVSGYLTYEHFSSPGGEGLICPATGAINCVKVTTSPQSKFLGAPVALLGLVFYLGFTVLNLPALWRSSSPSIRWGRLVAASLGMVFVLWLVYAELFIIKAICLWCTVVHVLTFALFVLVLYGTVGIALEEEFPDGD